MVVFQLDVLHNWPNKLLQKINALENVSLCRPLKSIVIHKPEVGAFAKPGLNINMKMSD
jgi:hypothetical protein